MADHTLTIANQTASQARDAINKAFETVASLSSGTSEPTSIYPNMLWYQTNNNRLKMRNEANTAWLDLGYIDQTDGLEILDNTKLVNTSGTQVGLLGDQSTATWEAGTGNIDSLVSPANIKAAILALATPPSLTLGTFTAASGNTFLDFTVPTTATEIYVNYYDVIPSGTVEVLMKVSGSPVTSGYYSSSGTSGAESGRTDSFYVYALSGRNLTGVMSITKAASNVWMETHSSTQNFAENSGAGRFINAGSVNGIRFQATSFSGGQVSVSYR